MVVCKAGADSVMQTTVTLKSKLPQSLETHLEGNETSLDWNSTSLVSCKCMYLVIRLYPYQNDVEHLCQQAGINSVPETLTESSYILPYPLSTLCWLSKFPFQGHLGKDIFRPQNVEPPKPTLGLYAEKQRHHSHPQEPSAFKKKNTNYYNKLKCKSSCRGDNGSKLHVCCLNIIFQCTLWLAGGNSPKIIRQTCQLLSAVEAKVDWELQHLNYMIAKCNTGLKSTARKKEREGFTSLHVPF